MRAELIRDVGAWNWISELSGPVLQALQDCVTIRPYSAPSLIYQTGDTPDCFYQILQGVVRLTNVSDTGRELIYADFSVGDCFGEISLIDNQPAPQTAMITTPGVIASIKRADFNRIAQQHPQIYEALLRNFCLKLRAFSQYYFDALLANLEVRLADNLCRLVTGDDMDVAISHEDLAKFVGASRQSVSTVLKRWESARLIRIGYGVVQVRDLPGLRQIVNFQTHT